MEKEYSETPYDKSKIDKRVRASRVGVERLLKHFEACLENGGCEAAAYFSREVCPYLNQTLRDMAQMLAAAKRAKIKRLPKKTATVDEYMTIIDRILSKCNNSSPEKDCVPVCAVSEEDRFSPQAYHEYLDLAIRYSQQGDYDSAVEYLTLVKDELSKPNDFISLEEVFLVEMKIDKAIEQHQQHY